MVTLIGQSPNEFELHLRAILGLPIPAIDQAGPAASAVILAARGESFTYSGVADALALGGRGALVRQADYLDESPDGRRAGAEPIDR